MFLKRWQRLLVQTRVVLSVPSDYAPSSCCPQLRELRTMTSLDLGANLLTGTLPAVWCASFVESYFAIVCALGDAPEDADTRSMRHLVETQGEQRELDQLPHTDAGLRLLHGVHVRHQQPQRAAPAGDGQRAQGGVRVRSVLRQQLHRCVRAARQRSKWFIRRNPARAAHLKFTARRVSCVPAGTVPATYSLFSTNGISICHCPNLFGPLLWNITIYPEYLYWSSAWRNTYLLGTSIGNDRPLAAILGDIRAAVNPSGTALAGWTFGSTLNPCAGYSAVTPGRPTSSLYPSGFPYISCNDVYAGVALTRVVYGGVYSLSLSGVNLGGTVPSQLRDLRSTIVIDLTCAVPHPLTPSPALAARSTTGSSRLCGT